MPEHSTTSPDGDMRILIADDVVLVRAGLASLLRAHGHTVVGEARDGFEALEQARALQPDVILLDIEMPRCGGVEAMRLIRAEQPSARVVLLTDRPETGELIEAVANGIAGCVVKDLPEGELADAIEGLVEERPTPPQGGGCDADRTIPREKEHA